VLVCCTSRATPFSLQALHTSSIPGLVPHPSMSLYSIRCQCDCITVMLLQVWYLAGTLVMVNAIACVVVVFVAALIAPTHATEEVGPCRLVLPY
jgi:hypothetical protein